MPRNFSVNGKNTTASTTTQTTVIQLLGANLVRTWVFDITMGSTIAPADYATTWDLSRHTTASTVTSYTPLPLDPVNLASLAVGGASATGVNASAEGTYTAGGSLIVVPLNARATFRYVASPGAEFVNTFTAANGLGLRQGATTAIVGTGTLLYFE